MYQTYANWLWYREARDRFTNACVLSVCSVFSVFLFGGLPTPPQAGIGSEMHHNTVFCTKNPNVAQRAFFAPDSGF